MIGLLAYIATRQQQTPSLLSSNTVSGWNPSFRETSLARLAQTYLQHVELQIQSEALTTGNHELQQQRDAIEANRKRLETRCTASEAERSGLKATKAAWSNSRDSEAISYYISTFSRLESRRHKTMPTLLNGFLGTGALCALSVDFPSDPMRKSVKGSMH
jgi:phage shock protein A